MLATQAGHGDGRLIFAVAINVLLTVAQIAGGLVSGSLSLVADALHNLNDAASLAIALCARRIARRPADFTHTFGHGKAELVGALINLTTLILVGIYLIYEAVMRFFDPQPIAGWIVVIVAGFALVVDAVTAVLTYAMSRDNLNLKAAFVHNLSDAFASVGVIIAGTLIILYQWYWADLVATLIISAYILWQGLAMMHGTVSILMDAVPPDVDLEQLVAEIAEIDGVTNAHDVHVWRLSEHRRAMEAHVVLDGDGYAKLDDTRAAIKQMLHDRYRIDHSTLEFETEADRRDRRDVVVVE